MAENIKQLIRLAGADLDGAKSTYQALTKIKGVSYSISNTICTLLNLDKTKKIGLLGEKELNKITDLLKDPSKYNIKPWLLNRRSDYDSGKDKHLVSSDLQLRRDFDIKRMKEIKNYRGMRHAYGLPVRGQRTKAHFRKGTAVGVKRKATKKGRT